MDDQPLSPSVLYLDSYDLDVFDPAFGAALSDFSEEELSELFKDDITPPTPVQEEQQQQQYPQQQQRQDPGEPEEEKKEQFVQQHQRVRHEEGHTPIAECSLKPHLLPQSSDLDDSNSIEESLSVSTTSTCTRHGGHAYEKVGVV